MNKEALAQQIKDMETKLAEMKAELEKPEPTINYWQPKGSEHYWFVNIYGLVRRGCTTDPELLEKGHYRVFKTEEEANKYADYVKAEEILKKEIATLNEGWVPNWKNQDQTKYSFSLTPNKERVSIEYNSKFKLYNSFMYLKSRKLVEDLISTHINELITYLSY